MTTVKGMGSRWGNFLMMLGVICLLVVLSGCASSKSAEPETGSMVRTYTLLDEQGKKSGTLVINPVGSAELRDVDGNVIGTLSAQPAASSGTTQQPEAKP